MSVQLSPSGQLGFQRPLTQLVKRTLSVTNSSNQHAVAYKVKTTAPKQYCVRPNSGRIEPGETVEVHVLLQPMKEDPAPGAKCRDKFLVQSVAITPERESVPLADLWKQLEEDEKARSDDGPAKIHEQKIRCAYLPAAESDVAHSAIPEEQQAAHDGDVSRMTSADASFVSTSGTSRSAESPIAATSTPPPASLVSTSTSRDGAEKSATGAAPISPVYATHNLALGAAVGAPASSTNVPASSAAVSSSASPSVIPAIATSYHSTPAAAVAAAPATSSTTTTTTTQKTAAPSGPSDAELSRLRSELDAARAEISRLKMQLEGAETTNATLRSRGAGAGGTVISPEKGAGVTSQAVVDLKGQEGVPVQVVAGIAFGVFVVTWLFF